MKQHLPKTLPNFTNASILVIGDVMLDRYWFGDTGRISPEAPVPVVKINNADNRPGGAANVALNIGALGCKTLLLGITGQDEAANTLKDQLSAADIQHDLCETPNLKTIVKLRVISRHQQLLRLDFEDRLHVLDNNQLIDKYKKQLSQAKLIILSDYQKGTLADPQTLIALAKSARIPVLVDPKGSDFSIYQHADIITPNLKEFEAVVGKCHSEQEIVEKARGLLTQYHIQSVLVTRGEDGMTLITQTEMHHLPAYAREVYDVTGAGDTVIGMLGAALAAGLPLLPATALANLAASISVSKLGAATVSVPELEIALTGTTHSSNGMVNEEQLLAAVKQARAQNKKIVFTNGCYDVIHAGHVKSLQLAKELGDYLIVAVNTDESIQKLKGPNRPINHLEHRMTVLAGFSAVDWVVPFSDETPERLLQLLQPDVLVKGGDYTIDKVVGADLVRQYGGEVRVVNHDVTTSSSAIINRMKETANQQENV